VNTVTASFHAVMEQKTKMPQRRKKPDVRDVSLSSQ